jgi:hypothetical protein
MSLSLLAPDRFRIAIKLNLEHVSYEKPNLTKKRKSGPKGKTGRN